MFKPGDNVLIIAMAGNNTFAKYIGRIGVVIYPNMYSTGRIPIKVHGCKNKWEHGPIYYDPEALRPATDEELLAFKLGAYNETNMRTVSEQTG